MSILPTVSIAECATCGSVATEFGKVWGAAQYFKGSIVTYDNSFKTKYLGVQSDLVDDFMNRPKQVVIAMAKGVCQMFDSDIGLSTSGFATPYPPKGVTVPYIWYCIYDRRTDTVLEAGCVENGEYLSRGQFQRKLGMLLHVKYMIHSGNYPETPS